MKGNKIIGIEPVEGPEYVIIHKTTLKAFRGHYCGDLDCYNLVGEDELMAGASQYIAITEVYPNDHVTVDAKEYIDDIETPVLTKGHWYPCSLSHGPNILMIFNGESFNTDFNFQSEKFYVHELNWIGESLGSIDFGGNNNEI